MAEPLDNPLAVTYEEQEAAAQETEQRRRHVTAEALGQDMTVSGTIHTRGTDALPYGSDPSRRRMSTANPLATNAMLASYLHEQGMMTGEAEYMEGAMAAAEKAEGVGEPHIPNEQELAELEEAGVTITSAPVTPQSLIAPQAIRSLIPAEPEAEVEEEPEVEEEAELPDDIAALFEDDDVEEDELEPPEPPDEPEDDYERGQEEEYQGDYVPEGFEDEEKLQLKKQVAKLEKQMAMTEKQRAVAARKSWEEEAATHLPGAAPFLDMITAVSKKDFFRQAKAYHDRAKPHLEAQATQAKQEAAEERERLRLAAKEEAAQAWGTPVAAGPGAPTEEQTPRHVTMSRQRGNLGAQMTERLRSGTFGRL